MSETILQTVHGSHLYGLAHPGSDLDTYRVVLGGNKKYARQTKRGDDDCMVISLDRFLAQVAVGVPQALEALFSPFAQINMDWAPFLLGLRPGLIKTQMRYRRTIINFGFHRGGRTGSAAERIDERKLRRHAVRLTLNLGTFLERGVFNPALSTDQRDVVVEMADAPDFETELTSALESALWPT